MVLDKLNGKLVQINCNDVLDIHGHFLHQMPYLLSIPQTYAEGK